MGGASQPNPSGRVVRSLHKWAIQSLAQSLAPEGPVEWPEGLTPTDTLHLLAELAQQGHWTSLEPFILRLDVLLAALQVSGERQVLHRVYQGLIDAGQPIHQAHPAALKARLNPQGHANTNQWRACLNGASNYAGFLMEAGWFDQARQVWLELEIWTRGVTDLSRFRLEVRIQLLQTLSSYCLFDEAETLAQDLLNQLGNRDPSDERWSVYLRAWLYSALSYNHFAQGHYGAAYDWGRAAVQELHHPDGPPRIVLDVLCQASKAYVVKRRFEQAEILVSQACLYAQEVYGVHHLRYADALMALGCYLQNVDSIKKSVQIYHQVLKIRKGVFGSNNVKVALTLEDLAYVTYVQEYNCGNFAESRDMAYSALRILEHRLPKHHLLKASAKRVVALIIEEMAVDDTNQTKKQCLLEQAERLHLSSLSLAKAAFGEMNVQTAKHYGNLGRLYQSMGRFKQAEEKHLKAIDIKEKLLGKDDYEVCLSVGHLASLYNYELKDYDKAEKLYLRSVRISETLFGPAYSELEYDYRGLIQLYQQLEDYDKYLEYFHKFENWKLLRDRRHEEEERENQNVAAKVRMALPEIVKAVVTEGGPH
ncbi:amyloid protein-binding protein 2-like [Tigriopus californicus]|nr:amyloid protein-binding protein 2-like [Tigriopus californicus]